MQLHSSGGRVEGGTMLKIKAKRSLTVNPQVPPKLPFSNFR